MKLLCIVGPTATGKTSLAVKLSKLYRSTLISADSRQVYQELDVVTGKDHPQDVMLAGIDLVAPDSEFSVSSWYQAVSPKVTPNTLPIVVGGTALYVKTLLAPPATLNIPIDHQLRLELEGLTVDELQKRLASKGKQKLASMNASDAGNPRRLIRAIEVESFTGVATPVTPLLVDPLVIGLLPDQDPNAYQAQIRERVLARLDAGAIAETQALLKKYSKTLPSLTAIGYHSLMAYLQGDLNQEDMINTWVQDEYRYAKRQLLFFRKLPQVTWYDSGREDLQAAVENQVKTWYDSK